MDTDMIQGLAAVGVLVKPTVDKICNYLKDKGVDFAKKGTIDIGTAFKKYVASAREQNSKIQTFLYNNEGTDLESIYVCIDVKLKDKVISTSNVNDLLDEGNRILITGTGGAGKTTLLKYLFLNTLTNTYLTPIWVDLRSVNGMEIKDLSMEKIIYDILQTHKFKLEEEYFMYSLELDCYVFLLDGLDEVSEGKSRILSEKLRNMGKRFDNNYYIVSSRQNDGLNDWVEFKEFSSMDMNIEQAEELISKLDFDKTKKGAFIQELKKGLFKQYGTFASNPLLLTIMMLTYQDNMETPENFNEFYEQAYTALFNRHDSRKNFKRKMSSGLRQLEFKNIFAYVCFKSFMQEQYEFTENELLELIKMAKTKGIIQKEYDEELFLQDLLTAVCLIVPDGIKYKFSHRSFQEYFAAYFTCKMQDKEQQIILKDFVERGRFFSNDYIDILFNMQKRKVEEILILPEAKRLLSIRNKSGNIGFMNSFFVDANVAIRDNLEVGLGLVKRNSDGEFEEGRDYNFLYVFQGLYQEEIRVAQACSNTQRKGFREKLINELKEKGIDIEDGKAHNDLKFDDIGEKVTSLIMQRIGVDSEAKVLEDLVKRYDEMPTVEDAQSIIANI